VGGMDGQLFRGAAATVPRRLKAAFADYVRGYVARNAELKLQ